MKSYQGAFIAVPSAPGVVTTSTFTITPPAGQTITWDTTQAAVVNPGAMHFILMFSK